MEIKHYDKEFFKYLADIAYNLSGEKEDGLSNAKLIAAAPELLEALIECLEGVKELNGEYQSGWQEVIEKADKAIKKATE